MRIESVQSQRYACANEKLAQIPWHSKAQNGSLPYTVHPVNEPSVLLCTAGKIPYRSDSQALIPTALFKIGCVTNLHYDIVKLSKTKTT